MGETILLTGATGFVGRHVLPALLEAGWRVRALSRQPAGQIGVGRNERVEFVRADLLDSATLGGVFDGVDAALYLVHSMGGDPGQSDEFVARDKRAARHFAARAGRAGVAQAVYLSGLKPPGHASAHLESRREVERILGAGKVPLTVVRAGFIVGDGSAGCVMLDALSRTMDTLMAVPEFDHVTQPAYVGDVVEALNCCLEHRQQTAGQTYEIGSREQVSYRRLIELYARAAGRSLELVDVPWAPRALGAAWISAISGLPYGLTRALSAGLSTDLCVSDERLYKVCDIARTPPKEAILRVLRSN